MIDLVGRAEEFLKHREAWQIAVPDQEPPAAPLRHTLAQLRHDVAASLGAPCILATHSDAACLNFARRPDVMQLSQQGPATPDHVIRTKRVPLVGRDVQDYRAAYESYFNEFAPASEQPLTMLDPAPRVILDPELGMVSIGRTAKDAAIVEDIYRHTIDIILRANALDAYRALPARDLFEVEYWELEQAKLRRQGTPPGFAGEIALVTGAAAGIGKACVDALLARGAAVVGLDIDPAIEGMYTRRDFLGVCCNVTSQDELSQALEAGARAFGGLDMLILNAGILTASRRVAELELEDWRRVMGVNLDANVALLREAHPLLKAAPRGGRVVVIGSKNVPAPGPGMAAYSASKAALNQLARITALEWGSDSIRVNVIHPNAVFDTNLWTEDILQARAQHYNQSVEAYKRSNVLGVEVTSRAVGEMAAEMCGALFACTTGAQVPIDGGNERVI
jgi:NAD(P)-dependent dehydrogenase (short-subunit alcohol dehydrogenase family)